MATSHLYDVPRSPQEAGFFFVWLSQFCYHPFMTAHQDAITSHVIIHGTVQGVGFRDWTCRMANSLELDGWVRNRSDGTVEAVFHGALETVKQMLEKCHHGPEGAHVDNVEATPQEGHPPPGFTAKPTV
jgi:acylphosphatase